MKEDLPALDVLGSLGLPDEMLFRAQLAAARAGFARMTRRRRALRRDEIPGWQAEIRRAMAFMVGGFPERTPLNARVTGALVRRGYVVEKLVYESRPGFHVTAVLYLPTTSRAPAPGVLFPCGHSAGGKADPTYQTACIAFALSGYAVLCYDPLGQGERSQYWDARRRRSRVGICCPEHGMCGAQCVLLGTNLAQWRIWDGMRSLDYLASRPEVDPQRILVTGNSGGGTLTTYIAATDERVALAAPGCYITTLEERFRTRLGADAEQNLLPQASLGIDHADMLAVMAPKPVIILAAKKDFFPIAGARWTYGELKSLYRRLGAGNNLRLVEAPGGHGFSKPLREAVVNFANGQFGVDRPKWREPEIEPEPPRNLNCTATGQVATSLDSRTVFSFNLDLLQASGGGRRRKAPALKPRRVAELLRLRVPAAAPRVRRAGVMTRSALTIERLAIESEPGILVPALRFRPAAGKSSPCVVVLASDEGKSRVGRPRGLAESLARRGIEVLAVDIRGIGETRSKSRGWGDGSYMEHDLAYTSWMIDRPLMGGWTLDLISACRVAQGGRVRGRRVILAADGVRCATAAVFAGALSEVPAAVVAAGALASFRDVVATEIWDVPVAVFIPGVIGAFNIGDIAGLIAPRPLALLGATGPDGRAMRPGFALKAGFSRDALRIGGAAKAAFGRTILRLAEELAP